MHFQPKLTNHRNYLDVLACVDPSMEGFTFRNFTISSISIDELLCLVNHITKGRETEHLRMLLNQHALHIPDRSNLLIQEFIPSDSLSECYDFSVMLHLYKSSDIYSCYSTTYRFDGSALSFGGNIQITHYEHAGFPDYVQPNYFLTNEEKLSFSSWYEKYHPQIFGESNSTFKHILRTYIDSFLIGKIGAEYIYLFTILESLFVSKNQKIKYQISHNTASFLSSSKSEQLQIAEKLTTLYRSRSEFVHNAKVIDQEDLFALREIIRQLLLILVDFGYARPNADFKSLKKVVDYST